MLLQHKLNYTMVHNTTLFNAREVWQDNSTVPRAQDQGFTIHSDQHLMALPTSHQGNSYFKS